MKSKSGKLEKLNAGNQKKTSAGVIMAFRHRLKSENDDGCEYEYWYEVKKPDYGMSFPDNKGAWVKCDTLDEAIQFDWKYNADKEIHLVETWQPEGQRDKILYVNDY